MVRVQQEIQWRPRDQVPNRFPTSPPLQGRVWQECCTPFDSTALADTPGFTADAVSETIPASSGAVRRLFLVGAQVPAEVPPVHGRRVVLVPEPTGTPQSMEGMVVDDVNEDSVRSASLT